MTLLARLKGAWPPRRRHDSLQLVVLAQGAHTITTLMIAAFHKNWTIRFAMSSGDAMALLGKAPSAALIYDWDTRKADWRKLCGACVDRGVPFHLAAEMPPDDLFLAVACAGGADVLWKPLRAAQIIAAVDSARNAAQTPPPNPLEVRTCGRANEAA